MSFFKGLLKLTMPQIYTYLCRLGINQIHFRSSTHMKTPSPFNIWLATALLAVTSCGQSNQQQTATNNAQTATNQQAPATTTPAPIPPATNEPAATIPDFNFYRLNNGMRFDRSDLSYKGNIVVVFFDPTCVQCQDEARDIANHYDRIESASLYFVSMNDPALVDAFLPTYASALAGQENVVALYDRDRHFISRFHMPTQYPSTYIYGPDGRLKTYWNGYKDIEEIVAAINN